MLYMATAMAKISKHTNNKKLLNTCKEIFNDIVDKKMYVTGGVGSTVIGEAFEEEYILHNDTMYCETCAAIAMAYFSYEMYKITKEEKYFKIVELELYNGVLSGASNDFKHFFYVNPLEINLEKIKDKQKYGHIKAKRPAWLGCACCPANFLRTIGSINKYIYNIDEINQTLYINLLIGTKYLKDEQIVISQETNYPYNNRVKYMVGSLEYKNLKIRIPDWMNITKFIHNNKLIKPIIQNNYLTFNNIGKNDIIEIEFDTKVTLNYSNEKVITNIGKVALSVGPFILSMENIDNSKDLNKYSISLANIQKSKLNLEDNIIKVRSKGYYENKTQKTITFIPYYYIANRGITNMQVYIKTNE